MEKILVYIGLNNGKGFEEFLQNETFDRCFGFEPLPELYEKVKEKYKDRSDVEIINAAVVENEGEYKFFRTNFVGSVENKDSSSLYEITEDYRNTTGNPIYTKDTIIVKGINLMKFLSERNVHQIYQYVSDAEGNDFVILKTIKKFIDDRKIEKIKVESVCDYVNFDIRSGQPSNKESDFIDLLKTNYDLYDKQEGQYNPNLKNYWVNRDLHFKLKGDL